MISVPVNSDGTGGSLDWTTKARLYYGTTMLPLESAEVISGGDNFLGVNISISSGDSLGPCAVIRVTGFNGSDTKNKKFTLRLTSTDGISAVCTAYVNKIPVATARMRSYIVSRSTRMPFTPLQREPSQVAATSTFRLI